ncbi:MAG: hypothetical protein Q7V48_14395 [Deltaproteobacteria bacterium]|nr:hypothetical protein [Deltaproteobacteria bacterium]
MLDSILKHLVCQLSISDSGYRSNHYYTEVFIYGNADFGTRGRGSARSVESLEKAEVKWSYALWSPTQHKAPTFLNRRG